MATKLKCNAFYHGKLVVCILTGGNIPSGHSWVFAINNELHKVSNHVALTYIPSQSAACAIVDSQLTWRD